MNRWLVFSWGAPIVLGLIAGSVEMGAAGQAPGPGSGAGCRTYAAEEVSTVTGPGAGTITQSCHFDPARRQHACTIRSRTEAGDFTLTDVQTYASIADFVDEVRVIPPVSLVLRETRRFSRTDSDSDISFEHDKTGRQTRALMSINGQQIVVTYGEWDAKGRSTVETSKGVTAPITLRHVYDDNARTTTTTGPSGVDTKTYDANGNMTREVSASGKEQTVYAIVIAKTETVCKQSNNR